MKRNLLSGTGARTASTKANDTHLPPFDPRFEMRSTYVYGTKEDLRTYAKLKKLEIQGLLLFVD